MSAYGGSYPGSFVPMLQAARRLVQARGWSFEAVFTDDVEHFDWYADLRSDGVPIRVAPPMTPSRSTAYVRMLLGERRAPTLIHTHFSQWDIPAAIAARRTGSAAVFWHLHSPLKDERIAALKNVVRFGLVGRAVERILCVGPEIRERAVARMAPAARTEVLANGIDVARYPLIDEAERRAAREQLSLPERAQVLLLFGWDWERKGGDLLLGTVAELRRRGQEVLALVVGAEATTREGAKRLGIGDAVCPIAPVDDTRSLYGAADVFVAASTAEGLPFALLEALCCGTPAVASDIPSHRYVATGLPSCRLAQRRPSEFADAVAAELAAEPGERGLRVAESRSRIEREHSLDHWSLRLGELYSRLLPSFGDPPSDPGSARRR
jgi:glycosyltransferase involved in cell wall biosynthesis